MVSPQEAGMHDQQQQQQQALLLQQQQQQQLMHQQHFQQQQQQQQYLYSQMQRHHPAPQPPHIYQAGNHSHQQLQQPQQQPQNQHHSVMHTQHQQQAGNLQQQPHKPTGNNGVPMSHGHANHHQQQQQQQQQLQQQQQQHVAWLQAPPHVVQKTTGAAAPAAVRGKTEEADAENGAWPGSITRSNKACDHCHVRKIKCRGGQPCARCQRQNLECTYNACSRRRYPKSGVMEAMEAYLVEIATLLIDNDIALPAIPKVLRTEPTCTSISEILENRGKPPATFKDEHNNIIAAVAATASTTARSSASDVSKTGAASSSTVKDGSARASQQIKELYTEGKMTVQDLLTAGGVDSAMGEQASVPCEVNPRLVEYYFETAYTILPIFHRRGFMQKLMPVNRHSPLLLMAIYAAAIHYAIIYDDLQELHLTKDMAETTFYKVVRMIPDYMDVPALSTVQALLVLKSLSTARNNFGLVTVLKDLALRQARTLGFHRNETPADALRVSWVESERRRRAYWMAFNFVGEMRMSRWMSIRPNYPLVLDETGVTQSLAAPEDYFQSMDPDAIIPFHERLAEQQLPFNEVLGRIRTIPLRLDGFAILTLVTRTYGYIIRFVRTASRDNFSAAFMTNNPELGEIATSMHTLQAAAMPYLSNLDTVRTGRTDAEFFTALFSIVSNFCELILFTPAITSFDVTHVNLVHPQYFEHSVENARRIILVAGKVHEENPAMKGMPILTTVIVFYAALTLIADVIHEPTSPRVPSHLRQVAIARTCIRQLTKVWTLLGAQNEILRTIIAQHQLNVPDLSPPPIVASVERMKPKGSKLSLAHILLPTTTPATARADGARERFHSCNESLASSHTSLSSSSNTNDAVKDLSDIYRALGVSTFEPFPILFDNSELAVFSNIGVSATDMHH